MIEIVAEGCAQRGLIAFFHHHQVDRRRPQLLGFDVEQLGERSGLGLEPLDPPLGLVQRGFGGIEPLARRRLRGFRPQRHRFRLGNRTLRALDRGRELRQCGRSAALALQGCELGFDLADLALEPHKALGMLPQAALQLVAPRGEIGERRRDLGRMLLGANKRGFRFAHARADLAVPFRRRCALRG